MTLDEMLGDLPKPCTVGTKKNSQGFKKSGTGYTLHIDSSDGGIPVTCLLRAPLFIVTPWANAVQLSPPSKEFSCKPLDI